MPVYSGANTPSAFYVGTGTASAIYKGSTQVWPTAAPSGPALVSHFSALTTTASSSNAVPGVTAAAGNVLVLVACTAIANPAKYITSITDPAGNTWTMRRQVIGAAGAANSGVEIWTTTATGALSNQTLTAVSSGGTSLGQYDVSVWSGVTTTGILANSATDNGQSASPACTVSPTDAAVVLGGFSYGSATAPTAGPGAGFTTLAAGSSGSTHYGTSAYSVVATAGTYGPSWTRPGPIAGGIATIALPHS